MDTSDAWKERNRTVDDLIDSMVARVQEGKKPRELIRELTNAESPAEANEIDSADLLWLIPIRVAVRPESAERTEELPYLNLALEACLAGIKSGENFKEIMGAVHRIHPIALSIPTEDGRVPAAWEILDTLVAINKWKSLKKLLEKSASASENLIGQWARATALSVVKGGVRREDPYHPYTILKQFFSPGVGASSEIIDACVLSINENIALPRFVGQLVSILKDTLSALSKQDVDITNDFLNVFSCLVGIGMTRTAMNLCKFAYKLRNQYPEVICRLLQPAVDLWKRTFLPDWATLDLLRMSSGAFLEAAKKTDDLADKVLFSGKARNAAREAIKITEDVYWYPQAVENLREHGKITISQFSKATWQVNYSGAPDIISRVSGECPGLAFEVADLIATRCPSDPQWLEALQKVRETLRPLAEGNPSMSGEYACFLNRLSGLANEHFEHPLGLSVGLELRSIAGSSSDYRQAATEIIDEACLKMIPRDLDLSGVSAKLLALKCELETASFVAVLLDLAGRESPTPERIELVSDWLSKITDDCTHVHRLLLDLQIQLARANKIVGVEKRHQEQLLTAIVSLVQLINALEADGVNGKLDAALGLLGECVSALIDICGDNFQANVGRVDWDEVKLGIAAGLSESACSIEDQHKLVYETTTVGPAHVPVSLFVCFSRNRARIALELHKSRHNKSSKAIYQAIISLCEALDLIDASGVRSGERADVQRDLMLCCHVIGAVDKVIEALFADGRESCALGLARANLEFQVRGDGPGRIEYELGLLDGAYRQVCSGSGSAELLVEKTRFESQMARFAFKQGKPHAQLLMLDNAINDSESALQRGGIAKQAEIEIREQIIDAAHDFIVAASRSDSSSESNRAWRLLWSAAEHTDWLTSNCTGLTKARAYHAFARCFIPAVRFGLIKSELKAEVEALKFLEKADAVIWEVISGEQVAPTELKETAVDRYRPVALRAIGLNAELEAFLLQFLPDYAARLSRPEGRVGAAGYLSHFACLLGPDDGGLLHAKLLIHRGLINRDISSWSSIHFLDRAVELLERQGRSIQEMFEEFGAEDISLEHLYTALGSIGCKTEVEPLRFEPPEQVYCGNPMNLVEELNNAMENGQVDVVISALSRMGNNVYYQYGRYRQPIPDRVCWWQAYQEGHNQAAEWMHMEASIDLEYVAVVPELTFQSRNASFKVALSFWNLAIVCSKKYRKRDVPRLYYKCALARLNGDGGEDYLKVVAEDLAMVVGWSEEEGFAKYARVGNWMMRAAAAEVLASLKTQLGASENQVKEIAAYGLAVLNKAMNWHRYKASALSFLQEQQASMVSLVMTYRRAGASDKQVFAAIDGCKGLRLMAIRSIPAGRESHTIRVSEPLLIAGGGPVSGFDRQPGRPEIASPQESLMIDQLPDQLWRAIQVPYAVVNYLCHPEGVMAVVLAYPGDGSEAAFTCVDLPSEDHEPERLTGYILHCLQDRSVGDDHLLRLLQKGYKAFLGPLEESLEGIDLVFIVPHDYLAHLPFHALFSSRGVGDPVFFIKDHEVAYLPAALVLRDILMDMPHDGPSVVVGHDKRLEILEPEKQAVFRELENLGALVTETESADNARERLVPAGLREYPLFTVVHWIAHGEKNERWERALESCIKLDEQTTLTAGEWLERGCQAAFLYGHSCRIGRGDAPGSYSGDLYGWPFALFGAPKGGSQSCLLAVTDIKDSEPSIEMAKEIYKRLTNSVVERKSTAVAQAMRSMIDHENSDYRNPRFWAPYMFMGDPRPLVRRESLSSSNSASYSGSPIGQA